jgi:hypothetical protein
MEDSSTRRRGFERGRLIRFALPLGALAVVGAMRPEIAQRLPAFFFPAVAATGGALTLVGCARVLGRSVRQYRQGRRVPLPSLLLVGVALVFLVVLPLSRLVRLLTAAPGGPPRVLAGFGAWLGGEGYPRPSPHRGVDFKGAVGADVLAVADGKVVVARDSQDLCGLIIVIVHDPHGYRTVYCHSSAIAVQIGDIVTRGQRIGAVGTTGQRAWPGYEHVHLELQRGMDANALEDPMSRMVGCFEPAARYPAHRLALTYPLRC